MSRPKRWKSLLLTFAVVFPCVQGLNRGLLPLLGPMPWWLRDLLMVASLCVVLSAALPWAMQKCQAWLQR